MSYMVNQKTNRQPERNIGAASPRKSPTVTHNEEAGEKIVSLKEWIFGPPSPEISHIDAPPSPKKGYTTASDGSSKSIGDEERRTVILGPDIKVSLYELRGESKIEQTTRMQHWRC